MATVTNSGNKSGRSDSRIRYDAKVNLSSGPLKTPLLPTSSKLFVRLNRMSPFLRYRRGRSGIVDATNFDSSRMTRSVYHSPETASGLPSPRSRIPSSLCPFSAWQEPHPPRQTTTLFRRRILRPGWVSFYCTTWLPVDTGVRSTRFPSSAGL